MTGDTETETWHFEPHFRLSAYVDGEPFVVVDVPKGDDLPILSEGFLGFDLPEGTSRQKAGEIVDFLNENIRFITYTGPIRDEFMGTTGRGEIARKTSAKVNRMLH